MQYNQYHSTSQQPHHPSHPSQSPDDYPPSSYPDPSHQHAALSYAAVTPASPLPAGSIAHQSMSPQYPYSHYATSPTTPDERAYYPSSPQASAVERYPATTSPPVSYAAPNTASHSNHPPTRHNAQLSQAQFIPTPSQTYLYSSGGSPPSTRSRPAAEPYYHMSPNPQHVLHAPPASAAHGVNRSSTTHHHSSLHSPPAHVHGTVVPPSSERYLCNRCERSFTRSHDRRRHYDTVHSTSPVFHKCRYCRKDFSRSDSLKRHVDNGCDEMPR